MLQGVSQAACCILHAGDIITGSGKKVVPHLGPGLQKGFQVFLMLIVTVYDVCNAPAFSDGAVAVAELPVVKHLEAAAHTVVPYGKGIDCCVGVLDTVSQHGVKSVLVDAFPSGGAAEAAQTAAFELKVANIHETGLVGIEGGEIFYHGPQALVPFPEVTYDDGIKALLLYAGAEGLSVFAGGLWLNCGGGLIYVVFHTVNYITEKLLSVFLPLNVEQILHACGQAVYYPHAHVVTILFNKTMGGNIVKVHGGA